MYSGRIFLVGGLLLVSVSLAFLLVSPQREVVYDHTGVDPEQLGRVDLHSDGSATYTLAYVAPARSKQHGKSIYKWSLRVPDEYNVRRTGMGLWNSEKQKVLFPDPVAGMYKYRTFNGPDLRKKLRKLGYNRWTRVRFEKTETAPPRVREYLQDYKRFEHAKRLVDYKKLRKPPIFQSLIIFGLLLPQAEHIGKSSLNRAQLAKNHNLRNSSLSTRNWNGSQNLLARVRTYKMNSCGPIGQRFGLVEIGVASGHSGRSCLGAKEHNRQIFTSRPNSPDLVVITCKTLFKDQPKFCDMDFTFKGWPVGVEIKEPMLKDWNLIHRRVKRWLQMHSRHVDKLPNEGPMTVKRAIEQIRMLQNN